jgi:hypothetical protein
MVVNSVLPSLLNLAQIVSILNTTVAATTTTESTLRYYLDTSKDRNSYGRRENTESVEHVIGKCLWL